VRWIAASTLAAVAARPVMTIRGHEFDPPV
jgi:hypothetical protein